MARWKIVGGPRDYEAGDVTVGWAWDIEADTDHRTIHVEIAGTAARLFGLGDAERALRDVLDEDDPPERLMLTTAGVVRQ